MPDISLIVSWLLSLYYYIPVFTSTRGIPQSRPETNFFTNWNATWYSWVGKTWDIVEYSIISAYDTNKTHNSILKIPLFLTPYSHLSQNGHGTMDYIAQWTIETTNLLRIFDGSFFAHPLPDILIKHNIKETASKGNIYGPFYTPKGKSLCGR